MKSLREKLFGIGIIPVIAINDAKDAVPAGKGSGAGRNSHSGDHLSNPGCGGCHCGSCPGCP